MKFSEMKYERPVIEQAASDADRIKNNLENAETFEDAEKAFLDWEKLSSHIDTMMSIAYIRNSIDTNDEYYEKEVEYIDETSPLFVELEQGFTKLLVKNKFRKKLEEKYGSLLFKNAEMSLEAFSPEIIPEVQEINKLETAYQKLIASAQIEFDGDKRTLSQMTPYKQSPNDEIRRSAWIAEGEFYNEHGKELDEIYDKMVKLRTKKLLYTAGYRKIQKISCKIYSPCRRQTLS